MPSIKPNVYVANQGAHDYSDAERYGTVVNVTKGLLSKFGVGIMARTWADVIKTSKPEDYIVSGSLTTMCSIGCSLFAIKHGHLNLLLFKNGHYICRRLMLSQLLEGEKDGEGKGKDDL